MNIGVKILYYSKFCWTLLNGLKQSLKTQRIMKFIIFGKDYTCYVIVNYRQENYAGSSVKR